jgi:hypothetical protein
MPDSASIRAWRQEHSRHISLTPTERKADNKAYTAFLLEEFPELVALTPERLAAFVAFDRLEYRKPEYGYALGRLYQFGLDKLIDEEGNRYPEISKPQFDAGKWLTEEARNYSYRVGGPITAKVVYAGPQLAFRHWWYKEHGRANKGGTLGDIKRDKKGMPPPTRADIGGMAITDSSYTRAGFNKSETKPLLDDVDSSRAERLRDLMSYDDPVDDERQKNEFYIRTRADLRPAGRLIERAVLDVCEHDRDIPAAEVPYLIAGLNALAIKLGYVEREKKRRERKAAKRRTADRRQQHRQRQKVAA